MYSRSAVGSTIFFLKKLKMQKKNVDPTGKFLKVINCMVGRSRLG